MKKIFILIIIVLAGLLLWNSFSKESSNEQMIPVEPNGGIGDGALPLDQVLEDN